MDDSKHDSSKPDTPRKDVHANVGIFISSTPDETKLTQQGPKPATSKATFPFRIILVSNLAPEHRIDDWQSPNHLRRLDRNKYAGLFEDLAPALNAEIVDRSGDTPEKVAYLLRFSSLKDFTPKGIVTQIPELAGLWAIRDSAAQVAAGNLTLDEFRREIERLGVDKNWSRKLIGALDKPATPAAPKSASSPSLPESDNPSLDHLFEMVNIGSLNAGESDEIDHTPPPGSPGALVNALAAVAGSQGPSIDASAHNRIIHDIEKHVAHRVNLVVQNEKVRELEARWRGLKFFLDHLDFRSDIILDVLPVGPGDLAEAIHYQIVIAEHENRSTNPASLIVYDREFGHSNQDVEALTEIASVAENIQTPAVCSLSPVFWGNHSVTDLATLPVIWQQLEGADYFEWVKFTQTDSATHISLVYPPVLLRGPNDSLANEDTPAENDDLPLFGAAAIATAAILSRRFSNTGWPTFASGTGEHVLSDLLIWDGGKSPGPLAAIYREEKNGELVDSGITVLTGLPSRDQIQLYASPTVSKRITFEDEAATEKVRALRSLEAQLFVSRIVHFLITEQESVNDQDNLASAREYLETKLKSLLGIAANPESANFVGVIAVETGEGSSGDLLDISVEAPPSILVNPVGFRARIPFGG